MNTEKIDDNLKTIDDLKGFHFIVEDYQRGFKWDIKQIDELLFDINHFEKGVEDFYCLQPVVITEKKLKNGVKRFELIDGQQRLTSIFIFLKCLNLSLYTISYKTRDSSEDFLNSIDKLPHLNYVNEKLDDFLNQEWEKYIFIFLKLIIL